MNKIVALMLVAAFAVVAGCAQTPAEEEVMLEGETAVEVVIPTNEEVPAEEAAADATEEEMEEEVAEEEMVEEEATVEVEVY